MGTRTEELRAVGKTNFFVQQFPSLAFSWFWRCIIGVVVRHLIRELHKTHSKCIHTYRHSATCYPVFFNNPIIPYTQRHTRTPSHVPLTPRVVDRKNKRTCSVTSGAGKKVTIKIIIITARNDDKSLSLCSNRETSFRIPAIAAAAIIL